jgi:hypothetical protein
MDNALVEIDDWKRAQQLANGLEIKRVHSSWTSLHERIVRSTATSAFSITGVWINASTPPT